MLSLGENCYNRVYVGVVALPSFSKLRHQQQGIWHRTLQKRKLNESSTNEYEVCFAAEYMFKERLGEILHRLPQP